MTVLAGAWERRGYEPTAASVVVATAAASVQVPGDFPPVRRQRARSSRDAAPNAPWDPNRSRPILTPTNGNAPCDADADRRRRESGGPILIGRI
mmetsp:Transcript_5054/g.10625  ORF Transcript_5054/g.10625 Transcript_5054/m.10625 type:complete len:94 (+) Transcript_5054:244-525(+)